MDWIVCISIKEIDPSKFDYYTIRINLNDKKCYIFTQYNYAIKTNHIYRDIIGIKKESIDLESVHASIGRFTYLNVEDGLTIGNDYFGFEKIFYTIFDDLILISNRLHCLLDGAEKINLKFKPDYKYIKTLLASNIWLFSQQSFSTRTC